MRKVNSFKIIMMQDEVLVDFHRYDPDLLPIYGQSKLRSTLVLPVATIDVIRKKLEVNDNVSTMFFLERMVRKNKGVDIMMSIIRRHKLKYRLSAHTHC